MIFSYTSVLISACIASAICSEFFAKFDPCAKQDSCYAKPQLRTCSCDSSCHMYGTCCRDFQKDVPTETFRCYQGRSTSPIFVKKSCSDDFLGHVGDKAACLDDDQDEMDIKNNLLVTSHKTKVTYWNKKCATCSNEASEDLEFWNIEVFCEPRKDVDRNVIRRNLTFDQDKNQWGLQIGEEFLQCIIKYAPPPYIGEVRHCTPNLISSCPPTYNNEDTAMKCSQYYGERKLKNSETYYKNIHCALCNDVNPKDLQCLGMATPEENVEETDFRDMVEEVFTSKQWLNGQTFLCSRGHVYDPLREMCRRYEMKNTTATVPNAASSGGKGYYFAMLAVLFAWLY